MLENLDMTEVVHAVHKERLQKVVLHESPISKYRNTRDYYLIVLYEKTAVQDLCQG